MTIWLHRHFVLGVIICALVSVASGQEITGQYRVGYTKHVLPVHRQSSGEKVDLLLNVWYPTYDQGDRIRLLDFTWLHSPASDISDSLKLTATSSLKKTLKQWFGEFEETQWTNLANTLSSSQLNATPTGNRYPLIVGRLRAFSTTYTVEELASHGFIVCMLTNVDDYPPDNREAYIRQLSDEIAFFSEIKKYFFRHKSLSSGKAALMGFSGNGLSPFIAAMHSDIFSSVALLESGVFLRDLYEILKTHPYFSMDRFNPELLFLYNKQRFENENMTNLFNELPTRSKQLVLIDNASQHHWDFATEGTIASKYLNNRSQEVSVRQLEEFRKINQEIVSFFNRTLKENK